MKGDTDGRRTSRLAALCGIRSPCHRILFGPAILLDCDFSPLVLASYAVPIFPVDRSLFKCDWAMVLAMVHCHTYSLGMESSHHHPGEMGMEADCDPYFTLVFPSDDLVVASSDRFSANAILPHHHGSRLLAVAGVGVDCKVGVAIRTGCPAVMDLAQMHCPPDSLVV
jgi:hypothetical protein